MSNELLYEVSDGIAVITINRPEVRNAFRPKTVRELLAAFDLAHEDPLVGAVILTGEGDLAFCSGGDQKVRGHAGYVGDDGVPRLNVLDLQKKIRSLPKPVVAMVADHLIVSMGEQTPPEVLAATQQRLQADVMHLDRCAILFRTRHRDLELARQEGEFRMKG